MKRWCSLLMVCMAMGVVLQAQDTPKGEFFIGYAMVKNFDFTTSIKKTDKGDSIKGLILHGWNSAVSYNLSRVVGIVGEVSGAFGSKATSSALAATTNNSSLYTFLVGPRMYARSKSRLTPFVHVLFGGTYQATDGTSKITTPGNPPVITPSRYDQSVTAFALAAGGGLDYNLGPKISVRLAQLDYRYTRGILESNLRYSAGLLFKF